jgi:hypothetical protein
MAPSTGVLFYERLMRKTAGKELERLLQVLNFHQVDPERMRPKPSQSYGL